MYSNANTFKRHFIQKKTNNEDDFWLKNFCNESNAEITVVAYSNVYVYRRINISGTDNQYLMYALNVFNKDINDLKKTSVV